MDIYFAALDKNPDMINFVLNNNFNILLSYANDKNTILKYIESIDNHKEYTGKMFVDSGAFSVWTRGKSIDIDTYIDFINCYDKYFDLYASLDVITKDFSIDNLIKTCEQTWDNFIYMRNHVSSPDKLVFTYHIGEPIEYLYRALNYEDAFGKIKYMALGGLVGTSESDKLGFIQSSLDIIKDSNNPTIDVHLFGVTQIGVTSNFAVTSCDSSTSSKAAVFGELILPDGTRACIGDRRNCSSAYFYDKNPQVIEEVERLITDYGFTVDEMKEDPLKRKEFNMMVCRNMADHKNIQNVSKTNLW